MHHDADDADMVAALGQFASVGRLIAGHGRAPAARLGPTLTAPEADPVCGSYLPKHSLATLAGERMGGEYVWVSPTMRIQCSTGQTGQVTASAQVSGLRTVTITASEAA
jgi:hypothetical protein